MSLQCPFRSLRDVAAAHYECLAIFWFSIRDGLGSCVRGDRGGNGDPDSWWHDLVHGRFAALCTYTSARRCDFQLDAGAVCDRDAMAWRSCLARHVLSPGGIAQGAGVIARKRF